MKPLMAFIGLLYIGANCLFGLLIYACFIPIIIASVFRHLFFKGFFLREVRYFLYGSDNVA